MPYLHFIRQLLEILVLSLTAVCNCISEFSSVFKLLSFMPFSWGKFLVLSQRFRKNKILLSLRHVWSIVVCTRAYICPPYIIAKRFKMLQLPFYKFSHLIKKMLQKLLFVQLSLLHHGDYCSVFPTLCWGEALLLHPNPVLLCWFCPTNQHEETPLRGQKDRGKLLFHYFFASVLA